ncbi:TIGR03885 family FMN-dependent LLM class oxidoreductase [Haloarcula onubensis]|uniref:TIGR03885 family FMN-dependent LLM class oxidoreductase n=1 Tax=Haloarcula onubensis TaxID=2950539 RepID=A0ABU2FS14_9EURY|nr:TIGR03885 family FMN-dependent LLM class oxidoreductase [Halomicroarcula sp. S3CR25-11]MDS0283548.1 TIGR03885 family FMN-dependent LLM class oxidoreductase [Halomicroarcula sp. S3CR25-11]
MPDFGYHASHEQFAPGDLVARAREAEAAGFTDVLASDHFQPWSERQGEAGFVWSWLGSAMEATSLTYGTVNAPGYRYHPAVVAQAAATLRSMYPERFWLTVGSGELLNEHITGERWPTKEERNAVLEESVAVMRRLWRGETVTHRGHVTVEEATLYTRPETPPPVFGAALSTETAAWLADWADGMLTVATPDVDRLARIVRAFRDRAPDKPVAVKAQLSYDADEETALAGAYDQWRTNCVAGPVVENLRTTEQFDTAGESVSRDEVRQNVQVSADLDEHRSWLADIAALDVDRVYLHNVNRRQEQFVERFGDAVVPALAGGDR